MYDLQKLVRSWALNANGAMKLDAVFDSQQMIEWALNADGAIEPDAVSDS